MIELDKVNKKRWRISADTVQIWRTEVGTAFIASAVAMNNRSYFIDRWNGSPMALHFHGGRDEDGPYLGCFGRHRSYLNDIAMKTVPTSEFLNKQPLIL
jgi:hypothetical protein